MSTYVIGDVHGCIRSLSQLLARIKPTDEDALWFVGDLVNRGPDGLAVLRLIQSLPNAVAVLGNHDLHLLALYHGVRRFPVSEPLAAILDAPDVDALCVWLQALPLLHHDETSGYVMVHAGLWPFWTLGQAKALAKEAEQGIAAGGPDFWPALYGNLPALWSEDLAGMERLRFIINAFTRMRYCDAHGALELTETGPLGSQTQGLMPWFGLPDRVDGPPIVFGHWASLQGVSGLAGVHAVDTGCAWGKELTAMRLADGKRFAVAFAD